MQLMLIIIHPWIHFWSGLWWTSETLRFLASFFRLLLGKDVYKFFKVHIIYTCSPSVVCSANYAWFGFVLNIFCELRVPRCNQNKSALQVGLRGSACITHEAG